MAQWEAGSINASVSCYFVYLALHRDSGFQRCWWFSAKYPDNYIAGPEHMQKRQNLMLNLRTKNVRIKYALGKQ